MAFKFSRGQLRFMAKAVRTLRKVKAAPALAIGSGVASGGGIGYGVYRENRKQGVSKGRALGVSLGVGAMTGLGVGAMGHEFARLPSKRQARAEARRIVGLMRKEEQLHGRLSDLLTQVRAHKKPKVQHVLPTRGGIAATVPREGMETELRLFHPYESEYGVGQHAKHGIGKIRMTRRF